MNRHTLERRLPLAAAIVLGFTGSAAAQQPPGNAPANDPAANQAENPADAGDTGAVRTRAPAVEQYLPLTVDRFNRLDEDKDGALSAAELAEDAALEDRFEDIDADRNREIDPGEFRGYQPEDRTGDT